jgi:hypothetical protein
MPGGVPLRMSVNLSLKQIQHSGIVADVRERARGVPPRAGTPHARDHRVGADGRHGARPVAQPRNAVVGLEATLARQAVIEVRR